MTKSELLKFIAGETGLSREKCNDVLNALFDGVVKGLQDEGKVSIIGFCTFTAKDRPEKEGRNPRTGESIIIPARTAVSIKAGSKLKDALN